MRFLVDENVRLEVVNFLINEGHEVKIVPSGMKNSDVISLARKEQRVLLTHDVHFSNILMYPPKSHFGIIRIKIHPPSVDTVLTALKSLLDKFHSKGFSKRLIVLEKDGFRVRK